jgi:hypothetical protein
MAGFVGEVDGFLDFPGHYIVEEPTFHALPFGKGSTS